MYKYFVLYKNKLTNINNRWAMKKEKINIPYTCLQIVLFLGLIYFGVCWLADFKGAKIILESKNNCLRCLWCLLFSFLPGVIKLFKVKCTKTCETYFLFAITVHFILGGTFNLYKYSIFSSVVHFANSFLIGAIIFGIVLRNTSRQGKFFLLITTTACVVLVGVLWEMVEFSIDGVFGANMQRTSNTITQLPFIGRRAIFDTMADLSMDVLGGLCAGLFSNLIKINKKPFYLYFELKSAEPRKAMFGEIEYIDESVGDVTDNASLNDSGNLTLSDEKDDKINKNQ